MIQDRRSFLSLSGSTFAAVWLARSPDDVREALRYARKAALNGSAAWEFLTPEQAADIEAITGQIIPSEPDSPGAREAGVVYYVDRDLARSPADDQQGFLRELGKWNAEVAKRWPGASRFSQLPSERQIEFLTSQEKTDFFGALRLVTMIGMFGNPSYGGNRDNAGWKLIGFEDRYAWQPPFGDYDAGVR